MVAASPATLHLLAQVLFVASEDKMSQLADQQPDTKLQQPYAPLELTRLKTCKQLLIAMEARLTHGMLIPTLCYMWTCYLGSCCCTLIDSLVYKHEVQSLSISDQLV